MGYHRFTPLLLDTLTSEHNNDTLSLGSDLTSSLEDTEDQDLQDYAAMIKESNDDAKSTMGQTSANMPTLTLKKSTMEMFKSYDGLMSSMFLSKIKDNIASVARRFKNTE